MVGRAQGGFRASEPQPVTYVELFFDLVFVFAVTQLTASTAHDLTPSGILRSILLGWLIWWAWTQFTWTLNPADTTHPTVRVVTLAATAVALVMSASVPQAFTVDALWFALPYVIVRVLGLGLQIRVELERIDANHGGVYRWAGFSAIGLLLVLVGAVADPSIRPWIWLLAILADLLAAAMAGRGAVEWDMDAAHLSERHGAFVIIAIGESLIIAGAAVANVERSVALEAAAAAAILVASLLWWTYFGWLKESLEDAYSRVPPERNGDVARDAFSLAHFPLIAGIVGFAVALEGIGAHPDEPMSTAVLASLGVGVALFVGSSALSLWLAGGPLLLPRLGILALMIVAFAALAALQPPPVWPLLVVAVALFAIVLTEGAGPATETAAPAVEVH